MISAYGLIRYNVKGCFRPGHQSMVTVRITWESKIDSLHRFRKLDNVHLVFYKEYGL